MTLIKYINRYRLVIILVIELLCASNVKWGGQRWKGIIAFDGKGYYAYLPAIFIYHDLQLSFHDTIEKKYSSPRTYYEFRVVTPNGIIDKYFGGTAVAELPFFIFSNLLTKLTGGNADGYSFIYQLGISLAGIIYGLVGLFFLQKTLRIYSIPENIITIVLFTIFFGTQLFYYSVFDPSMSHVYSFAVISAFLFILKNYIDKKRRQYLILLGILLGWIVLIRPVNGLIIFILPFLAGNKENFSRIIKNIFKNRLGIITATLFFLLTSSMQALIYFFQTGHFLIDSYVVENFIWNRPEIINILFSYKKGLFIYTPLALISLAGLIIVYKRSSFQFWSFILFFLIISYVFSCWWMWWYGGSFSARPYTEFLSLFAILLAFLLTALKNRFNRLVTFILLIFSTILCQIQTYQFRYYIIHWEKMDKEHYWRVFMRVDQILKKENANEDLLK